MSVEVDDLFAGGGAPPPADPLPRVRRLGAVGRVGHLIGLLGGAAAIAISLATSGESVAAPQAELLGRAWIVAFVVYLLLVPSVLVALYAWHRAGEELDRVRIGALPRGYAPGLRAEKRRLLVWLGIAGLGMTFQAVVLSVLMAAAPAQ